MIAVLPSAAPLTAQDSIDVEREAVALYRDVMSPYCPGLTLATCPSPGAEVMRDSLRAALASGKTRREVLRGLREAYGPEILASPEPRGLGLVAWVAPFLLLLAGGLVLTRWVRRRGASGTDSAVTSVPGAPLDAAAEQRLRDALRHDR